MEQRLEEIAPRVYGLVGGPVNVYLIDDPASGVVIVDAGLPGWSGRILRSLGSIGRKPEDVSRLLITHADLDHVGALRSLVEATGAEVCASTLALPYLRERRSPPHIGFPMIVPVVALNFLARRGVDNARALADGERLDTLGGLRAVYAEGHTPDHLCFYLEREGMLFAGDLLRNVSSLELFPRIAWSREAMRASLRKVAALDPRIICPGHGRPWRREEDTRRLAALLEEPEAGECSGARRTTSSSSS